MRWKLKEPKPIKTEPKLPNPNLGDTKEVIKFAYTIKRVGDYKILWEKYIEVYEYKMCTIYTHKHIGMYKLETKSFNLPQWKLKELKLFR